MSRTFLSLFYGINILCCRHRTNGNRISALFAFHFLIFLFFFSFHRGFEYALGRAFVVGASCVRCSHYIDIANGGEYENVSPAIMKCKEREREKHLNRTRGAHESTANRAETTCENETGAFADY